MKIVKSFVNFGHLTIETQAMKKRDIEVFRRAVDLASSGDYQSWNEVQQRLVEKGYLRVPELLDGSEIKRVLDAQCAIGRERRKEQR